MEEPVSAMPPGGPVDLPGRGRTWAYDSGDPPDRPGAPVLVLLHGWTSSAALNWYRCFPTLAESYRVLAVDHRGHGRGIRSRRPFTLEDCADDVAALIDQLGIGPVVAVGYSMGGPVAQYLWYRHRGAVSGLVLCATAARFTVRSEMSGPLGTVSYVASLALSGLPDSVRRRVTSAVIASRGYAAGVAPWAVEEWHRHDAAALLQAGLAIGRFDSREWIGEVDVPSAVVVTTQDATVSPARQWQLAQGLPGALAFPVAGDHRVVVDGADVFLPVLLSACRVATGAGTRAGPAVGAADAGVDPIGGRDRPAGPSPG